MRMLDAAATADALPWAHLVDAIAAVLGAHRAGQVQAPERMVLPITPEARWFVMPAWTTGGADAAGVAAVKLITYHPSNPLQGRAAIQGDVIVMRTDTGERIALLDGPTVTARRTAAVSALAARALAAQPGGPLLVFGAGPQAETHVEAFRALFGVEEVWVRSRTPESASRLATQAAAMGCRSAVVDDLAAALARCTVVVTATPAAEICLDMLPGPGTFVAAVGAFTPSMAEVAPHVVRQIAAQGRVVLDSASARHEAGDLLQAGLDIEALPLLGDVLAEVPADPAAARSAAGDGVVLFKSCGSGLWDLAAARCVAEGAAPSNAGGGM